MEASVRASEQSEYAKEKEYKAIEKLRRGLEGTGDDYKKMERRITGYFTEIAHSIARLSFEGGKFKDYMIDVMKRIGEAIEAEVSVEILKATGLIQAMTSGVNMDITKLKDLLQLGSSAGGNGGGPRGWDRSEPRRDGLPTSGHDMAGHARVGAAGDGGTAD